MRGPEGRMRWAVQRGRMRSSKSPFVSHPVILSEAKNLYGASHTTRGFA